MVRYEISAAPWSAHQRTCRWSFGEFWHVLGSAVVDESFLNQFKWAPFTNNITDERGASRPPHRWNRLCLTQMQREVITTLNHTDSIFYLVFEALLLCVILILWDLLRQLIPPGRFEWTFRWVILELILIIDDWSIFCQITLRWYQYYWTLLMISQHCFR